MLTVDCMERTHRSELGCSRLSSVKLLSPKFFAITVSQDMDRTMFQLRSFVHQRLYTAAEEILGEVEKAITLALNKAEVRRHKEDAESPPHQQDFQLKKSGLGLLSDMCECLILC